MPSSQQNPNESDDEENLCPICFVIDLKKEMVLTKCQHKFCPTCYVMHMQRKTDCPLCRAELIEAPSKVDLTYEKARQIVHLDIIQNPHYIPQLEEALDINNTEKSESEKIQDCLTILSKFGISIAYKCKDWYK
jgi:hypothetical protein